METNKTVDSNGIKLLNGYSTREIHYFSEQSNEIEEIISRRPPFFVRWGIVFFFVFLLMLCSICWFVQYPDIVHSRGTLNSINAPKQIQAKTSGKLVKLFVKENDQVKDGDIIGYMESNANHQEVINLSIMLDSISKRTESGNTNDVIAYSAIPYHQLGELQSFYQTFSNAFVTFISYLHNGFYLQKKQMLAADIIYLKRLHSVLQNQKELLLKDLLLADSSFLIYQTLKREKVISTIDYRLENSKFISKQLALPQINASIVTNESQQHEKQKEIAELENQIEQQKNIFVQSLNTMKSQVEEWEKKYLLIAPVSGFVSFAGFLQENKEIKSGELICYVNPGNTNYYAEAFVSQYNFGKLKLGQTVLLKFQAYPYQEFGYLKGAVDYINTVPTDSGFLAKISISHTLLTNYNKTIQYKTGLQFEAEIITDKLNLLQRLFYSFRKIVT